MEGAAPPPRGGAKKIRDGLYSTCASPVVPHPSTRHAHGCLASEIGRDPAFPTRYDRTESPSEGVSLTRVTTEVRGAGGPAKGLRREREREERE